MPLWPLMSMFDQRWFPLSLFTIKGNNKSIIGHYHYCSDEKQTTSLTIDDRSKIDGSTLDSTLSDED